MIGYRSFQRLHTGNSLSTRSSLLVLPVYIWLRVNSEHRLRSTYLHSIHIQYVGPGFYQRLQYVTNKTILLEHKMSIYIYSGVYRAHLFVKFSFQLFVLPRTQHVTLNPAQMLSIYLCQCSTILFLRHAFCGLCMSYVCRLCQHWLVLASHAGNNDVCSCSQLTHVSVTNSTIFPYLKAFCLHKWSLWTQRIPRPADK